MIRISTFFLANTFVLNSLSSQAIGAGNPKLSGVWFQISFIFNMIFSVPFVLGAVFA